MPIYKTSNQLYTALQLLFNKLKEDPRATRSVAASRILIRLSCTEPDAEVSINGRTSPVEIHYGPSALRPDLDVMLTADALHHILLAEMPLRRALASGQMKVKGPVWRTFALQEILHQGQAVYPQVYENLSKGEQGQG